MNKNLVDDEAVNGRTGALKCTLCCFSLRISDISLACGSGASCDPAVARCSVRSGGRTGRCRETLARAPWLWATISNWDFGQIQLDWIVVASAPPSV